MLRILGLLFVVVLAVAGVGAGYWFHQDRQARDYVIATTPIVYKSWNADALTHRSASVAQTPDYEAQVRDVFRLFGSHLGPLESSEPPQGALQYGRVAPGFPTGLFGKYVSEAKFREGEATIAFTVVKEEGGWRIAQFEVTSNEVVEGLKKQGAQKPSRRNFVRGPSDEEAAVLAKAEEILALMDSEDPGAAWHKGFLRFQEAVPKRRFVAGMKRMHDMTGRPQARKLQGVGFRFNDTKADPPGDYAVADYESTYARATLHERIGFYKHDGTWYFSSHQWERDFRKAR